MYADYSCICVSARSLPPVRSTLQRAVTVISHHLHFCGLHLSISSRIPNLHTKGYRKIWYLVMVKPAFENNGHERTRTYGHADARNNGLVVRTTPLGAEAHED